jgi:hypothetical protein
MRICITKGNMGLGQPIKLALKQCRGVSNPNDYQRYRDAIFAHSPFLTDHGSIASASDDVRSVARNDSSWPTLLRRLARPGPENFASIRSSPNGQNRPNSDRSAFKRPCRVLPKSRAMPSPSQAPGRHDRHKRRKRLRPRPGGIASAPALAVRRRCRAIR